jgi:hypothetical protein
MFQERNSLMQRPLPSETTPTVIYKSAHRKFKPAINSLRPAKKAEHPLPAGVESEFLTQMRILAMWHKLHKSKEYGRVDFYFMGHMWRKRAKDAQQLHLIAVAIRFHERF